MNKINSKNSLILAKKTPRFIILCLCVASMLNISSCKKKDTSPPITNPTSCNTRMISDLYLTTPTTWYKDTVYILNGSNIINATLTIQPGTIVKFKENATIYTTDGPIIAIGTVSEPIIFTAYTDDDYCGDNNGDGTATIHTKGYWGGIALHKSISNFIYCKFLYAGANTANGANLESALAINPGADSSIIDHCTFAHTSGGTDQANAAVKFFTDIFNVSLTNNIFYDNGAPITFQTPGSAGIAGPTNVFHNPDNILEKNVQQAIIIKANQVFSNNTDLNVTEVPYLFYYASILKISSNIKVTLANNVILKLRDGMEVDINGANGSGFVNISGAGVLFTSAKDDIGGDSNGDGSMTTPAAGDWVGIYDSNIPGTDKWLHQSNFKYSIH